MQVGYAEIAIFDEYLTGGCDQQLTVDRVVIYGS